MEEPEKEFGTEGRNLKRGGTLNRAAVIRSPGGLPTRSQKNPTGEPNFERGRVFNNPGRPSVKP
jgi:hypothetical protein